MAVVLIISLALTYYFAGYMIDTQLAWQLFEKGAELDISFSAIEKRYAFAKKIGETQEQFLKHIASTGARLQMLSLENTPEDQWQTVLDSLADTDEFLHSGIYRDGKPVFLNVDEDHLYFDEDEWAEIKTGGSFAVNRDDNKIILCSIPMDESVLVTHISESMTESTTAGRKIYGFGQNISGGGILVYNIPSGIIMEATEKEYVGGQIDENPVLLMENFDEELTIFQMFQYRNMYWTLPLDLSEEVRVIIYFKLGDLLAEGSNEMLFPILFFLLVSHILIFSARFGRTIRTFIRDRSELIHIRGNFYIDRLLVKRITSLMLVCLIMMGLISSYILLLNQLSSDNARAYTEVQHLIQDEKENLKLAEDIRKYRDRFMTSLFGMVVRMMETDNTLASNEKLSRIAEIINVNDISLFTADGKAVASSTGYTGYKLSQKEDEDSMTGMLWKIIDGREPAQLIPLGGDKNQTYYASKYRTGSGIIRFDFFNNQFKDILNNLMLETMLEESDLGYVDLMYYNQEQPDKMLISRAEYNEVTRIDNPLDLENIRDGHFQFSDVGGKRYYLNFVADSNMPGNFFIVGQLIFNRLSNIASILFYMAVCFLLIYVSQILMLSVCVSREDKISDIRRTSMENENDDITEDGLDENVIIDRAMVKMYQKTKEAMEHNFAIFLRVMYIGIIIVFVLNFLLDYFSNAGPNSMARFLLQNKWERGFNIFSVTVIALMLIFMWVLNTLIVNLIRIVSENMGPAGVTIGHLMMSFTSFIILLGSIVFILAELGVNTGTILASAGLTSVVIGIGAQSTVNNILSGLFIIFEGNFRVGDIVLVDGWTGMIKGIGVRTTRLESYGLVEDYKNLRVIDNSDFKNITNLSRSPSMAVILIPVPYEADLDYIDKLFHENAPMMRLRLPEMLETPVNDGLLRLDSSAKIMRFRVKCNEADRITLERRFQQLVVEMLESNGINIPFDQLVLHQGSDFRFNVNTQEKPSTVPEQAEKPEEAEKPEKTDTEETGK